jgi:hypothetical protein
MQRPAAVGRAGPSRESRGEPQAATTRSTLQSNRPHHCSNLTTLPVAPVRATSLGCRAEWPPNACAAQLLIRNFNCCGATWCMLAGAVSLRTRAQARASRPVRRGPLGDCSSKRSCKRIQHWARQPKLEQCSKCCVFSQREARQREAARSFNIRVPAS